MKARKPVFLRSWMVLLTAFLMLSVIVFLAVQIRNTRQEYEQLVSLTPEPTIAPPPLEYRPVEALLRVGSIGPEVIQLQNRLKELGFYDGEVDGKYFAGTETAVLAFQTQHGLDADGMAGAQTLEKLYSTEAQHRSDTVPSPQPGAAPESLQDAPEGVYTSPVPGPDGD